MDWTDGELDAQVNQFFARLVIGAALGACTLGGLFAWKLAELLAGR